MFLINSSPNDNPLDDAELLTISQASRNDESGVHQLSINFVQLELQPMIEAQRVNRHDEQGKSDASDPTVVESYIAPNNTKDKGTVMLLNFEISYNCSS